MTDAQHLSATAHIRDDLFAPLLSLSYIQEVNKKKLRTASYSTAEKTPHFPLVVGGVFTDQNANNNSQEQTPKMMQDLCKDNMCMNEQKHKFITNTPMS